MFPSPQERNALNIMKSELRSGITPQAFGLERLRHLNLMDQAQHLNSEEAKKSARALAGITAIVLAKLRAWLTITTLRNLQRPEV